MFSKDLNLLEEDSQESGSEPELEELSSVELARDELARLVGEEVELEAMLPDSGSVPSSVSASSKLSMLTTP